MSCDIAAAAFLWLASTGAAPAVAVDPAPMVSVASEPLFMSIIESARQLKDEVAGFQRAPDALPDLGGFKAQATALAALDLRGHLELKARGTDGDLKCILRGISEDLPLKVAALERATAGPARKQALTDLAYLLDDNIGVLTAAPKPPV